MSAINNYGVSAAATVSLICLLACLAIIPELYRETAQLHQLVIQSVAEFKVGKRLMEQGRLSRKINGAEGRTGKSFNLEKGKMIEYFLELIIRTRICLRCRFDFFGHF